jgi:small subunit ribosomal protein S18
VCQFEHLGLIGADGPQSPAHHTFTDRAQVMVRSRSLLRHEGVSTVDRKNVNLLRKFISDRGKIRARRVTGLTPEQQKQIARAIKNARELALLPYPGLVKS